MKLFCIFLCFISIESRNIKSPRFEVLTGFQLQNIINGAESVPKVRQLVRGKGLRINSRIVLRPKELSDNIQQFIHRLKFIN